jgi:pimeloyl-ACP methyl ester carboxylesterase
MTYETFSVPVPGGFLAGGVWHGATATAAGPTVLAIHGIGASHLAWPFVAQRLDGVRFIAPDLRGRAHSNTLGPPWDMPDHATDMLRVLDSFGVERAVVTGHSMGGFVACRLAARHPDRVAALVLVDGGLPLPPAAIPPDLPPADIPAFLLGPSGERLRMTFPDEAAYLDFWRAHPAYGPTWGPVIEAYLRYDLEPAPGGGFRSRTRFGAVLANITQMDGSGGYRAALAAVACPAVFLWAPRGLLDGAPLYPRDTVAAESGAIAGLVVHEIDDVNHYGIVMTAVGADQVANHIAAQVARRNVDDARRNAPPIAPPSQKVQP